MIRSRALTAASSIGFLLSLLCAAAWAAVDLPPHGDRSVHDLAGVIRPEDEARMEAWHRQLFQKTGVAIVVVAVKALDGEPIDDFAVRVGTTWGVGRADEDRGIVVAFALEERRVFIATGYGVEHFLPDGRVGAILDQTVIPRLRAGDASGGLAAASAALVAAAAAEHDVAIDDLAQAAPARRRRRIPGGNIWLLLIILFVFFIISQAQKRDAKGRRRRGGVFFPPPFGRGGFGRGGFGGGGFGGFGGGGFGGGGAGRGF